MAVRLTVSKIDKGQSHSQRSLSLVKDGDYILRHYVMLVYNIAHAFDDAKQNFRLL